MSIYLRTQLSQHSNHSLARRLPVSLILHTFHLGQLSLKEGKYYSLMCLKSQEDPGVLTPKKGPLGICISLGEGTAERNPRSTIRDHISQHFGWHSGKFCHLLMRPGFSAPGCIYKPTTVPAALLCVKNCTSHMCITNAHSQLI